MRGSLALCVLLAYWRVGRVGAQVPRIPGATEIPGLQLQYVTRVPPSQWELEGNVAANDFACILLRRKHTQGQALELIKSIRIEPPVRDYEAAHFEMLNGPDVVRVEVKEDGVAILQAPESIILAAQYRYLLPLLVKNSRTRAELLKIHTPFTNYELTLAPRSVRGFILNLTSDQIGKRQASFAAEVDNRSAEAKMTVDVRPSGTLKVRLVDESDEPAAARVYLTGSDGLAHTPLGSFSRISRMSGEYFFHARDSFEIVLPEGSTTIEAVRGMEYAPVRREVTIRANQPQSTEIRLDHVFPMYKTGWYSGDAHIHMNYINNELIQPEDVALQISGEGLDIANMMVANSSADIIHDARFFEGKPSRLSYGHRTLYWNEEMRNNSVYGHMCLFNLKQLVEPLFTGFAGTRWAEDYPPNYAQAENTQKQAGAVTYAHPAVRPGFDGANCFEFPVDLALGQIDAIDVLSNVDEPASMDIWYRALNCGLRCAISAGTDSFTNMMWHQTPGGGRVYVHVPAKFSYQDWIRNYKRGRSFASNGPVIRFTVNGKEPGDEIRFPAGAGQRTLDVVADAQSVAPMDKIEIVVNGKAVASESAAGDKTQVRLHQEIQLNRSSWVAARVWGPPNRLVLNDTQLFAHTSAVYCYLGAKPIASTADAAFWVDWIDRAIKRVNELGVFSTCEKHDSVIQLFRKAQETYKRLAAGGAE